VKVNRSVLDDESVVRNGRTAVHGLTPRPAWSGERAAVVRVLVVDDFPLVRTGIARALAGHPDIAVVGEAGDGRTALRLAAELEPDVVTLDIYMPGMGGLAVLECLRREAPSVRVLVVSASERAEMVLDAVTIGASGYVTKRSSPEDLRQAVLTVHAGGTIVSPALASVLIREYSQARGRLPVAVGPGLGVRDREILRLLCQGNTDREIGRILHISARTVQNDLTRIRQRIGVRRRSELARWAVEHAVL
jgi:DNA-binding NarL/FixJ family response regulator